MTKKRGIFDTSRTIHYGEIVPTNEPLPWERQPALPPVAYGYRDTPTGRVDTVRGAVAIPFLQGSIQGFWPCVLITMIIALPVNLLHGPWWIPPFCGLIVLAGFGSWRVWRFIDTRQEQLWQRERLERRDIDGDGHIGEPPTLTLELPEPNQRRTLFVDLGISEARAIAFAKGIMAGRSLSVHEWTGKGGLCTRQEFERLRAKLLEAGLVRWVNTNAHNQGVTLTRKGAVALGELAKLSPTELDRA
jgi:hypothetical protein